MATSEDLVPTNMPQGKRQELAAGRRAAGLDLSSEGDAPPLPTPIRAPQPQQQQELRPAREVDLLSELDPSLFPPQELELSPMERLAQSRSTFLQAIAQRLEQP